MFPPSWPVCEAPLVCHPFPPQICAIVKSLYGCTWILNKDKDKDSTESILSKNTLDKEVYRNIPMYKY